MLDLEQIKNQYPVALQGYERAILREYLQYKILQAIFESKYASQISFMGGTALRILHGNNRFSEDIDLDNLGLSWQSFLDLSELVERFLVREGFQVEIKNVSRNAFHCYLRFPEILFQQGLTSLPQEKILIQIDTFAQEYDYQPDIRLLNKFDVYTEIRVAPIDLMLSQKIFTAVNRKRAKGRDFFDISFLLSLTKPDFDYLNQKMGINDADKLRNEFLNRIEEYDFKALAEDVAPFLIKQEQINRVTKFKEFWQQVDLK